MSHEQEPRQQDFAFWRQEILDVLHAVPGEDFPDDDYFQIIVFGVETPQALCYENSTRSNIQIYPNIQEGEPVSYVIRTRGRWPFCLYQTTYQISPTTSGAAQIDREVSRSVDFLLTPGYFESPFMRRPVFEKIQACEMNISPEATQDLLELLRNAQSRRIEAAQKAIY